MTVTRTVEERPAKRGSRTEEGFRWIRVQRGERQREGERSGFDAKEATEGRKEENGDDEEGERGEGQEGMIGSQAREREASGSTAARRKQKQDARHGKAWQSMARRAQGMARRGAQAGLRRSATREGRRGSARGGREGRMLGGRGEIRARGERPRGEGSKREGERRRRRESAESRRGVARRRRRRPPPQLSVASRRESIVRWVVGAPRRGNTPCAHALPHQRVPRHGGTVSCEPWNRVDRLRSNGDQRTLEREAKRVAGPPLCRKAVLNAREANGDENDAHRHRRFSRGRSTVR